MNPNNPEFTKPRPDGTFRMYVKDKDGHEVSYRMSLKKEYDPPDMKKWFKELAEKCPSDIPGSVNYRPAKPEPMPKKFKRPAPFSTHTEELMHRKMLVELLTPEELALPDVDREKVFIRKELVHLGALRDLDTIGVEEQFADEARMRAYRRNGFSFLSWYCLLRGKWVAIFWLVLFLSFSYVYITSVAYWDR